VNGSQEKIIMGISPLVTHRKTLSIGESEVFEEFKRLVSIRNDLSQIACRQPELWSLDESTLLKRRKQLAQHNSLSH
jgi:hypothetical protein